MQQICAIQSCGSPSSRGVASRGQRLCVSCQKSLTGHLAGLPGLYQACEQDLEVHRSHPISMVRGRRPRGICLDDVTTAVRSDTIRVLSSWCEMIIEERGVTGLSSLDVKTLTSFLRTHLDWLVTQAVAADFAEDIAGLVADARRALNPRQVRTIDLGQCVRDGCGGMVRATIGTGSQGSVPRVRCDAGHNWPPRQWLDLGHRLDSLAGGALDRRSMP